ncbi:hypothetical protein L7F22_068520 [Adiantum nelumboides]|nr:hypothetical protein [Adiantum nelumboides]
MSDPYWRYVTKLAGYGGGGGSKKWRCSFCGIEKTGSVTRVKDHLGHVLGKDIDPCASVPADVKNSLAHWRATRMNICDPEEEGINVEAEGNTSQSQGEASSKRSRRGSPPASAHVSSTSAGGPGAKRSPLPTLDVSTSRKGSLQAASMKAGLQKQAMQLATRERLQRRGRRIADVGTSAVAGPSESSSSASSEESHEDEVQDEIGDGFEDSDA